MRHEINLLNLLGHILHDSNDQFRFQMIWKSSYDLKSNYDDIYDCRMVSRSYDIKICSMISKMPYSRKKDVKVNERQERKFRRRFIVSESTGISAADVQDS